MRLRPYIVELEEFLTGFRKNIPMQKRDSMGRKVFWTMSASLTDAFYSHKEKQRAMKHKQKQSKQ